MGRRRTRMPQRTPPAHRISPIPGGRRRALPIDCRTAIWKRSLSKSTFQRPRINGTIQPPRGRKSTLYLTVLSGFTEVSTRFFIHLIPALGSGVPVANVLFRVRMGELIELPYRRFSRHVVDRLVRTGYLQASKRHRCDAVTDAWNRFRQAVERMIADRHGPQQ